jgi:HEAT repeat protein
MKNSNIILFEPRNRLVEKAGAYLQSLEKFMAEQNTAIPLLLQALPYAEDAMKLEMIILLGSFAKKEMVWRLLRIMSDERESEEVRHTAAVQLGVTASFLSDTQQLVDSLIEMVKNTDPQMRRNAAFALGWEGNERAVLPLIGLLYDEDPDVQLSAVNALANLRDGRIFNVLLERMANASLEQKRCILYNLWRFDAQREEVVAIYLEYLQHPNETLRFDALVLLRPVVPTCDCLPAYERCLKDSSARVKSLALKRLEDLEAPLLEGMRPQVERLLNEPDTEVRQNALKLLRKWRTCRQA